MVESLRLDLDFFVEAAIGRTSAGDGEGSLAEAGMASVALCELVSRVSSSVEVSWVCPSLEGSAVMELFVSG